MSRLPISANVLIGVTLLDLKVTEDYERTYLSGCWVTNNTPYLYVRDEQLSFHTNWNHLINALESFKDFKKIYNKYNFSHFSEFTKYFEFVGKINDGLTSLNIKTTFDAVTEACDWLINLRQNNNE